MEKLPTPGACEKCGDTHFSANWLPEAQCYCDECACEYWTEQAFSYDDEE